MIKILNKKYTPLEVSIMVASILSDKDLSAVYKISKSKYSYERKNKHRKEITIRRRDREDEVAAGYAKRIMNIINTAKDIKLNGNLLLSTADELMLARECVKELLSDFFGREFII